MEIVSEGFHNLQVAIHGSLRVITTLEFLQHHLAKLGHRDLLVTHTLLQRCRNLQAAALDSVRRAGGFVQTPMLSVILHLLVASAIRGSSSLSLYIIWL